MLEFCSKCMVASSGRGGASIVRPNPNQPNSTFQLISNIDHIQHLDQHHDQHHEHRHDQHHEQHHDQSNDQYHSRHDDDVDF